jgi:uncharacterized membrane protein
MSDETAIDEHPDSRQQIDLTPRALVILAIILLVAIALRAYRIGAASMWADELMSLAQSTGRAAAQFDEPKDQLVAPGGDLTGMRNRRGWGELRRALLVDTHPPLYLSGLRIWRLTFSEGDVAARSLSAVWSALSVLLLFDIARHLHGRTAGLWAAALMAVASPQIEYAQEARGYAMIVALSLAALDGVVRIEKRGGSPMRLIAVGVSVLAATLTHYFAAPVDIAIGLYALIRLRGRDRIATLATLASAGLIFAVAWGPMFWAQRTNFTSNLGWIADAPDGHVLHTFQRVALLPLRFFVTPMRKWEDVGRIAAVLYLLALLRLPWRRDLLLWCLLGAATIGTVLVSDLKDRTRALEMMRYTLAAAPAAYAVVAALLIDVLARSRWLAHALPATALLACMLSIEETYNRYWKPDLRGYAQMFNTDVAPDDVVIVRDSGVWDWYHAVLYSAITHYQPETSRGQRPLLVLTKPASPEALAQLAPAPRVWIISGGEDPEIEQLIPGARRTNLRGIPRIGFYQQVILEGAATTSPATSPSSSRRTGR